MEYIIAGLFICLFSLIVCLIFAVQDLHREVDDLKNNFSGKI